MLGALGVRGVRCGRSFSAENEMYVQSMYTPPVPTKICEFCCSGGGSGHETVRTIECVGPGTPFCMSRDPFPRYQRRPLVLSKAAGMAWPTGAPLTRLLWPLRLSFGDTKPPSGGGVHTCTVLLLNAPPIYSMPCVRLFFPRVPVRAAGCSTLMSSFLGAVRLRQRTGRSTCLMW